MRSLSPSGRIWKTFLVSQMNDKTQVLAKVASFGYRLPENIKSTNKNEFPLQQWGNYLGIRCASYWIKTIDTEPTM